MCRRGRILRWLDAEKRRRIPATKRRKYFYSAGIFVREPILCVVEVLSIRAGMLPSPFNALQAAGPHVNELKAPEDT
jgi:hypothetical protein